MKPTRLTILDVLVLTGCCALGMGIARWLASSESDANPFGSSVEAFVFGVALPCLFGGVVFGHPALLATLTITDRRPHDLTFGEILGLMPAISCLASLAFVAMFRSSSNPLSPEELMANLFFFFFLLNLFGGFAAAALMCYRITTRAGMPWTDYFGILVAMMPTALVVLLLFASVLVG
ncbi:MAG: hypothetical protein SGJ19_12725 [Planctomycetia bacterium]|nr:hypothetical protein [Planctomycetia bacterium]